MSGPTGDPRVQRLFNKIRELYPGLTYRSYRRLCNAATRELRKFTSDCHHVELSTVRLPERDGYYRDLDVNSYGTILFLRITID